MTCDKCGKELEVIKTDTGGAFLPCECSAAERLISVIRKYKRGSGVNDEDLSTELELRLAAALEVALFYLDGAIKIPCNCCDSDMRIEKHCQEAVANINGVCK